MICLFFCQVGINYSNGVTLGLRRQHGGTHTTPVCAKLVLFIRQAFLMDREMCQNVYVMQATRGRTAGRARRARRGSTSQPQAVLRAPSAAQASIRRPSAPPATARVNNAALGSTLEQWGRHSPVRASTVQPTRIPRLRVLLWRTPARHACQTLSLQVEVVSRAAVGATKGIRETTVGCAQSVQRASTRFLTAMPRAPYVPRTR